MDLKLMPYHVVAYGLSDPGLVRPDNEDVWGKVSDKYFYVLADGMGGHQAGGTAATKTVEMICFLVNEWLDAVDSKLTLKECCTLLEEAIRQVNNTVWTLGASRKNLKGMGTTICSILFHEQGIVYAHVGDSRIYRIRNSKIQPMTRDHSLLRELVDMGQLSEEQASNFYYKNIITRAVGTEPVVRPTIKVDTVDAGDVYIMCTDGLTDFLSDHEIETLVNRSTSIEDAVKSLVKKAKDRGGLDNITVVIMQVHEVHGTQNIS